MSHVGRRKPNWVAQWIVIVALGVATFAVGSRLWTGGDAAWMASGPKGESPVTLSYVFLILVLIDGIALIGFVNEWRSAKKGKRRRAG
jgi:hypothetical protein